MSLQADLEDDLRSKRGRALRRIQHNGQTLLRCTECGKHKDESSFYKIYKTNSHRGKCKECYIAEVIQNRDPDREAVNGWNLKAKRLKLQGRMSLDQWLALKAAYNGRCAYCGLAADKLSPDHYYPSSWASQRHSRANLVTGWVTNCRPACYMCNRAKSNLDPEEFISWLNSVRLGTTLAE